MPTTTISPNMNLVVPVVGQDPGPQWASDLNSSLTLIDQHDHSSGKGVQLTPSGLNINADLPLNNNNLVSTRSVRLQNQSTVLSLASDLRCLYTTGVDLYFNDANGNQIQITQNGGIAGTSGSISNLTSPASAAYVALSSTFVWQSAANTSANMDAGAFILRNNTANSFGLTLSPPSLTSNYTIVLPTLPTSQKIVTLDNSGNMSASYVVDNSSIEIAANTIQVKAEGVTQPMLAPRPAAGSSPPVGSVSVTGTCGIFITSSSAFVDVTTLTIVVNVSSSQRPVKILVTSDGSGSDAYISATGTAARVRVTNPGATIFGNWLVQDTSALFIGIQFETYDFTPSVGNNTYKVQIASPNGNAIAINNYRLIAYEI